MIRFLYGDQLAANSTLSNSMFADRAAQFSSRLKWPVQVDKSGCERDEYDVQNPLYVIWQLEDGTHGGSMRFLPTTGPVMVNDHFQHLTDGVTIASPLIWECTRFCISPRAKAGLTAARLMLAAAELGKRFHLAHAVGVFDTRMIRVYAALGWRPEVLGTDGQGRDAISVGLWDFKAAPFARLQKSAKVDPEAAGLWFDNAFGAAQIA
ncbi:MAG: autoinducer synthase [Alphaproteobacteria bacterium]|nr:autoinducer synthase [Alphaproteobacteria bacterium]